MRSCDGGQGHDLEFRRPESANQVTSIKATVTVVMSATNQLKGRADFCAPLNQGKQLCVKELVFSTIPYYVWIGCQILRLYAFIELWVWNSRNDIHLFALDTSLDPIEQLFGTLLNGPRWGDRCREDFNPFHCKRIFNSSPILDRREKIPGET